MIEIEDCFSITLNNARFLNIQLQTMMLSLHNSNLNMTDIVLNSLISANSFHISVAYCNLYVNSLNSFHIFPGLISLQASSFLMNNSQLGNSEITNFFVFLSTTIYATETGNLSFFIQNSKFSNLSSVDLDGGGVFLYLLSR